MIGNYCDFFKKIAADPAAPVDGMTVSDFLKARQHLTLCEDCCAIATRVANSRARRSPEIFGVN